jgi:uncharacterized protein YegL
VVAPVDVLYVLDVSGSMNMLYPGSGKKLEAAQQAIKDTTDWIAQNGGAGSRVALVTFHGSGQGQGNPKIYSKDIQTVAAFTSDFAGFKATVDGLSASGSTPTGDAVRHVKDWLPGAWNSSNMPIVVLLSDGVPTVDFDGHGFQDYDVEKVHIYRRNGQAKTIEQVRTSNQGKLYSSYNERAGETLADTMVAIGELKAAMPGVTVHTIAIQATGDQGIFNPEILQYAAAQLNGQFFMSQDAETLKNALKTAIVISSCGGEAGGGGGGGGGTTVCENNEYNIENTTNNPFYGIKFEFAGSDGFKNGASELFKFSLDEIPAGWNSIQLEAKAGTRRSSGTMNNCDLSQPPAADGSALCQISDSKFAIEFLGTENNTLTFRLTNKTNRGLSHATFGLPDGKTASWYCPD